MALAAQSWHAEELWEGLLPRGTKAKDAPLVECVLRCSELARRDQATV